MVFVTLFSLATNREGEREDVWEGDKSVGRKKSMRFSQEDAAWDGYVRC